MYRTLVILRHTFLESVLQPLYPLLLIIGTAIIVIFAALPFFTLGEDAIMFKAVALDVILLLALVSALFATSRSIFEEIEDRTILTLMSKPLRRWQVLVGKYLGIITAAAMAIGVMGAVLAVAVWLRIPGDYTLSPRSLDVAVLKRLHDYRIMHLMGLGPALVNMWLQVAVLSAIGVALSTRFSLVVNLPTVILIYIAGNLTRFLLPIVFGANDAGTPLAGRSVVVKAVAWVVSLVLPYLRAFDDRERTVYAKIALPGTEFVNDISSVGLGAIWTYTGTALLYAVAYATFALAVGMWLFRTRELGGAEG
jgi:ABC-type transport system involved in multi-copper enzyme maturation permease subunit